MIQAEAVDAVRARPQLTRKATDKVEQLRRRGGSEVRHTCFIAPG